MDHHVGHRERLRERYLKNGLDAFAEHEMLELLLTYAIPRIDTKPIAYALLERFGSFHRVLQASTQELMQTPQIGKNAAVFLNMLLPVFRAYRRSVEADEPVMSNQEQCSRYCEGLLEGERYEKFYVICLDGQMRRINTVLISSGDIAEVRVYARHVLSALNQCNAMGAVITHNHPSGTAEPSTEDILLTNSISALLDGVGIKLYDHLIVSPCESFSFRLAGLIGMDNAVATQAAQNYERVLPAVRREIYQRGLVRSLYPDENEE